MTSCGHGVIQCSVDMYEGETFRHTLASHLAVYQMKKTENADDPGIFFGPKFFVNDVVCHYWPFAESIGKYIAEYASLTTDMTPFLSRVHGQAHGTSCQVGLVYLLPHNNLIVKS